MKPYFRHFDPPDPLYDPLLTPYNNPKNRNFVFGSTIGIWGIIRKIMSRRVVYNHILVILTLLVPAEAHKLGRRPKKHDPPSRNDNCCCPLLASMRRLWPLASDPNLLLRGPSHEPESRGGARGQSPPKCDSPLRNRYFCWCLLLSKARLWPLASALNPFIAQS